MAQLKSAIYILFFLVLSHYTFGQIRVYAFTSYEWLNDRNDNGDIHNPAEREHAQNFFVGVERLRPKARAMSFESGIGLTRKNIAFYENEADVAELESISPRLYLKTTTYIIGKFLSLNLKVDLIYDAALEGNISEQYKPLISRVSAGPSVMPVKRLKVYVNYVFTQFSGFRGYEAGIGYYFYQINK